MVNDTGTCSFLIKPIIEIDFVLKFSRINNKNLITTV